MVDSNTATSIIRLAIKTRFKIQLELGWAMESFHVHWEIVPQYDCMYKWPMVASKTAGSRANIGVLVTGTRVTGPIRDDSAAD